MHTATAHRNLIPLLPIGMTLEKNDALDLIEKKVREGVTGEVIVAGLDLEAHVYLQAGRVAWAYSDRERGAFLQELIRVTGLDESVFRDVLEECRAKRKHVAETLIGWGLASEHDVKRALWEQIVSALRTIAEAPSPSAIFLRRQRSSYDDRLTFDLGDFERERFSAAPPPQEDDDLLRREASLQQSFTDSVRASLWVKLVRPGGRSTSSNLVLGLVAETLESLQATEYAYREDAGWLFGLRHPDGFLFCGLRPTAQLSKARKTLYQQLGHEPPPPAPPLTLGGPVDRVAPAALASLRPTLENFDFIAGIYLFTPEGSVRMLRKGAPADLDDRLDRVHLTLGLPLSRLIQPDASPGGSPPNPVPPGVRMVLPDIHLLGAPIGASTLWLALCPSVIEGFGWGLLANAQRTLNSDDRSLLRAEPHQYPGPRSDPRRQDLPPGHRLPPQDPGPRLVRDRRQRHPDAADPDPLARSHGFHTAPVALGRRGRRRPGQGRGLAALPRRPHPRPRAAGRRPRPRRQCDLRLAPPHRG